MVEDARPPIMGVMEDIKRMSPETLIVLREWLNNYTEKQIWAYASSVRGVKMMPDGSIDSSDQ